MGPHGCQTACREPDLSPGTPGVLLPEPTSHKVTPRPPPSLRHTPPLHGARNGKRKEWPGKALTSDSRIFHRPTHSPLYMGNGNQDRKHQGSVGVRGRQCSPGSPVHTATSCPHRPRPVHLPSTPGPAATLHAHACTRAHLPNTHTHTTQACMCSHAHTILRRRHLRMFTPTLTPHAQKTHTRAHPRLSGAAARRCLQLYRANN